MNESFKQELSNLERKVKLLLREHQRMKKELTESRRENNRLKSELSVKENELYDFRNKWNISKLVGNIVAEREDSSELRAVLDEYIKEIDKCIAHLGEA